MDIITKSVQELKTEVLKAADALTKAIVDHGETLAAESALKEAEKAYAEGRRVEVFAELRKQPNPVKAALEMYSFPVIGHRLTRDDGVVTGVELDYGKQKQIDLVRFFEACNLKTDWRFKVEKVNQLMTLATAEDLKVDTKRKKEIATTFYMSDIARQIDGGKTPTSTTAMCKLLQQAMDEILFEDDGKGGNKYKVLNRDVQYLRFCHTKRGKKVLSVAIMKNKQVYNLMADIAHRLVTGKVYDLEFQMVKGSVTASNPEPKAESPKAAAEDSAPVMTDEEFAAHFQAEVAAAKKRQAAKKAKAEKSEKVKAEAVA